MNKAEFLNIIKYKKNITKKICENEFHNYVFWRFLRVTILVNMFCLQNYQAPDVCTFYFRPVLFLYSRTKLLAWFIFKTKESTKSLILKQKNKPFIFVIFTTIYDS